MSKLASLDPIIQKRLFDRKKIIGKENPPPGESITDGRANTIASEFAKTTWLKMSSLIEEGPQLMGGELAQHGNRMLRFGVGVDQYTGGDDFGGDPFKSVYGTTINFATFDETENKYLRPMPGIKSASIDYRTYLLREVNISWVCWSLEDLDRLIPYFLSTGKNILLEWGWSYKGYKANLIDLEGDDVNNLDGKLPDRIMKNGGDYDAMLGSIYNFEWSVRSDGGFDCTTKLMSKAANVLKHIHPSAGHSAPDETSEISEVDFRSYIKNLKSQLIFQLGGEESIKNNKDELKVFYWINFPRGLEVGPYVTWGWMEDNIISRFASRVSADAKLGNRVQGAFRSLDPIMKFEGTAPERIGWESTKITNHKFLYTVDPNRFILPGQYPVSSTGLAGQLAVEGISNVGAFEGGTDESSDSIKRKETLKAFETIATDFAKFSVGEGNSKTRGYLRNIVIHYKVIQEAFEGINTVQEGIDNLESELVKDFGQIFDFKIVANPRSGGRIVGLIDTFYLDNDVKETNESTNISTPDNPHRLFQFPNWSKNSIVKSQTMRASVPNSMQMAVLMSANSEGFTGTANTGTKEGVVGDIMGKLQQTKMETKDRISEGMRFVSGSERFGIKDADENTRLKLGSGITIKTVEKTKDNTPSSDEEQLKKQSEIVGKTATIVTDSDEDEPISSINWPDENEELIYDTSGKMRTEFRKIMKSRLYDKMKGVKLAVPIPVEVELQIDGIGGIQPLQHFQVEYIPQRYKDNAIFRIDRVSQTIDSNSWTTSITGKMIARRVRGGMDP